MRLPRFSIRGLMVVVGIVALNIAAVRVLSTYDPYPYVLAGVTLIGLALQVGLFRLIRGRYPSRMFWAGFTAFGSMAMMSFIWSWLTPSTPRVISGRSVWPSKPGSALWNLWHGYFNFAVTTLEPLPGSHPVLGVGGEMPIVTMSVISFPPQLLIALVGGLLAHLLIRRWSRSPTADAQPPAVNLPTLIRP